MPRYSFRARDKSGQEITSTQEAADQYVLARTLREQGYMLLEAHNDAERKKSTSLAINLDRLLGLFTRVSLIEKVVFSKNLGVMIGAGLALTRALEAMAHESHNKKFKVIISDVVEQVKQGRPFAESLTRHEGVFPSLYTSMIEAGEKSGKLQEALSVLATQLQSDYDLRRKVRGAVTYPAIVLTAMLGVGAFMMVYVVPTLTTVFTELNVALPASTQFIINFSNLLTNHGILMLAGLVVLIILFFQSLKWGPTMRFFDSVTVKFPLVGPIAKKYNAARTARTLSSLISAGVPILEAIDITSHVVQNHLYSNILLEAKSSIQKGDTISKIFLLHEDLYPSLVGEMLSVGEETGETSHMLNEVALFYEGQVADATRDLSTVVEPLLMVVIGVFVGFFAVSMIQPMYSITQGL